VAVLELEAPELPPTSYQWYECVVESVLPELKQFEDLPCVKYADTISEKDVWCVKYFVHEVQAVLFSIEDRTRAVCRLVFPSCISSDALAKLIANAASLSFDPASDALLIYKKDSNGPGPASSYIYQTSDLMYEFPSTTPTLYHLWYRLEKGITNERIHMHLTDLTIEYSEDGYNVTKELRRVFPHNVMISKVRSDLVSDGFLPETEYLRMSKVSEHKIESEFQPHELLYSLHIVRFDIIPEDQRNMGENDWLVSVFHCTCDSIGYYKNSGTPFWLRVGKTETVGAVWSRILKICGNLEERCHLIGQSGYVSSSSPRLRDAWTMEEAFEKVSVQSGTRKLAIVHPKKSTVGNEGVKIYN
jgi:hypothetical protein